MGDKLPEYVYLNNPPNYNPARNDAINLIAEQLSELGLDMNVEVLEWGTLYARIVDQQDYSFATWNRGLGVDPGRRMPEMFHSDNADQGLGNFTGYINEDLDPKLLKQMEVTDTDERIDLLHDIQETVTKDCPMSPIVQMPIIMPYHSDVSGWIDMLSGYNSMYNMVNIEVDNPANELRGAWSETLGTLNVVGYQNETKLIYQMDVLYDKLVRFDPNLQPDPEYSLAKDWERPDKTTIRYTIRDHQWHDGEDLTAEDVAFTLNYLKEHEAPLYRAQWERVKEAKAVDSQTAEITFHEDKAPGPVHTLFSFQVPIIPQHIWSERDNPLEMQVTEPVGSGPLMFDYWDEGSELGLKRNPDHWKPTNFEKRIWRIIPEVSTTWELMGRGDLNYNPFGRISKQLSDQHENNDNIKVKSMPGDGWWHFSQNLRLPGLGPREDGRPVRQACVNALPKTAINDQLLYGYTKAGWNLIGEAFGPYSNEDVMEFEEGVENGKQRLKDAGYQWDDDGLLHFPAE